MALVMKIWSNQGTYTLYIPTYGPYLVVGLSYQKIKKIGAMQPKIQNVYNCGPIGVHTPYICPRMNFTWS